MLGEGRLKYDGNAPKKSRGGEGLKRCRDCVVEGRGGGRPEVGEG